MSPTRNVDYMGTKMEEIVAYVGNLAGVSRHISTFSLFKYVPVFTGVHFFRLECNTAVSVMVYYPKPGVRLLHSS